MMIDGLGGDVDPRGPLDLDEVELDLDGLADLLAQRRRVVVVGAARPAADDAEAPQRLAFQCRQVHLAPRRDVPDLPAGVRASTDPRDPWLAFGAVAARIA